MEDSYIAKAAKGGKSRFSDDGPLILKWSIRWNHGLITNLCFSVSFCNAGYHLLVSTPWYLFGNRILGTGEIFECLALARYSKMKQRGWRIRHCIVTWREESL